MVKIFKCCQVFVVKVDCQKLYVIEDVLSFVKECVSVKFDELIDVVVQFGIDVKKLDQVVCGLVVLLVGMGKLVCVVVFV